jgi:hypothetical protein
VLTTRQEDIVGDGRDRVLLPIRSSRRCFERKTLPLPACLLLHGWLHSARRDINAALCCGRTFRNLPDGSG